MDVSKGELLLREILKIVILDDNVRYNCRDLGIKNHLTGEQLEIDIYYPDLKLAFEFQGEQHFFPTSFADEKEVAAIRARDKTKSFQCIKLGIILTKLTAKQLKPNTIRYRLGRKSGYYPLVEYIDKEITDPRAKLIAKECARYRRNLRNSYEGILSADSSDPVRKKKMIDKKMNSK